MTHTRLPRDFHYLSGAQALSSLGSEASRIAYPLLILSFPGQSVANGGLAATCLLLGQLLARLPGGLVADSVNRRAIMIGADLARMALMAVISIQILRGFQSLLTVLLAASLQGIADVMFSPAEVGALKKVVAKDQVVGAVVLYEIRDYAVVLAGPALGGLLFQFNPALPFAFDGLSYVLSIALISSVRTSLKADVNRAEPTTANLLGLVRGVAIGFTRLWSDAFLRVSVLSAGLMNTAMAGAFYGVVAVTNRAGASSTSIGLILSIASGIGLAGALSSPILLARVPDTWILLGWSWITAFGLSAMLLYPSSQTYLFGVSLGLAYVLAPAAGAIEKGYRISTSDAGEQGRLDAASTFVATLATPLGPLLCGVFVSKFGQFGLIFPAVVAAFGAVIRASSSSFRQYQRAPIQSSP